MKIKTLDNTHLIVLLSQSESNSLGFHPESSSQNYKTKFIASRIFEAACKKTDFSPCSTKINIVISVCRENTLLLFFPYKTARYKIYGSCSDLFFEFSDADSLIDALRLLKKEKAKGLFSLSEYKGKYFLFTACEYSSLHALIRRISEYSGVYGKSSAMIRKILEHGELVFSDLPINALF